MISINNYINTVLKVAVASGNLTADAADSNAAGMMGVELDPWEMGRKAGNAVAAATQVVYAAFAAELKLC